MQLIPDTAARFGVTDPWDPAQNIRGGAEYLAWLLRYFEGDLVKALAGYNAGEGAVRRYGGVPPYNETQGYVVRVQQLYAAYQQALAGGITLVNLPVAPYGSPSTC
jgi:soluble lytic murein transglycosylase-like protein